MRILRSYKRYFDNFWHVLMYYYVIRYVLLNQVEKTGIFDDIGGFTLDALVYLLSYNGSPKESPAKMLRLNQ